MTVSDLAKELNIGYGNARCLMVASGFPSFRVGRQLLVHPDDFQKWREKHYGCSIPARSKPKVIEHKRNQRGKYPISTSDMIADFMREVQ
jgi:hypothetical protein